MGSKAMYGGLRLAKFIKNCWENPTNTDRHLELYAPMVVRFCSELRKHRDTDLACWLTTEAEWLVVKAVVEGRAYGFRLTAFELQDMQRMLEVLESRIRALLQAVACESGNAAYLTDAELAHRLRRKRAS